MIITRISAMKNLRIEVVDNFKGWSEISTQWNQLLEKSSSATFFLTWEWLSSWAEHCLDDNRSLFVLALYENERLAGAAPFYIQKGKAGPFQLREIRFLGTPEAGSDYLGVFTRKGREKEVANTLYDFLIMGEAKNTWDQLVLEDIPSDSLFLQHFNSRIKANGKYAAVGFSAYCPLLKLPGSEAGLYAMCSPGWRKKIKQDNRVINREKNVVHFVSQVRVSTSKLDEFFRLYETRTGYSGGRLKRVLESVIKKFQNEPPPVQLDLLSINGRSVAGLVHLKYQDTLSMYLMAVDKGYNPKVSLGNFLVCQSIRNAIASGCSVYDFLKGDERYKFHWANRGIRTLHFSFWQKRPGAMYSASTGIIKNFGKLLIR